MAFGAPLCSEPVMRLEDAEGLLTCGTSPYTSFLLSSPLPLSLGTDSRTVQVGWLAVSSENSQKW